METEDLLVGAAALWGEEALKPVFTSEVQGPELNNPKETTFQNKITKWTELLQFVEGLKP